MGVVKHAPHPNPPHIPPTCTHGLAGLAGTIARGVGRGEQIMVGRCGMKSLLGEAQELNHAPGGEQRGGGYLPFRYENPEPVVTYHRTTYMVTINIPKITVVNELRGRALDASRLDVEAANEIETLMNALYSAWTLIANSNNGDWESADPEWRKAARRWRDEDFHPALDRNEIIRPEEPIE